MLNVVSVIITFHFLKFFARRSNFFLPTIIITIALGLYFVYVQYCTCTILYYESSVTSNSFPSNTIITLNSLLPIQRECVPFLRHLTCTPKIINLSTKLKESINPPAGNRVNNHSSTTTPHINMVRSLIAIALVGSAAAFAPAGAPLVCSFLI